MSEDTTLEMDELEALAKLPGALRIITNEHACGVDLEPRTEADLELCAAFEHPLTDPRHFVQHDVVRLEARDHLGTVRAHSAEGDWTEGKPGAVLKRLRDWRG